MRQNYGNVFFVNFQKIIPVVIIDDRHNVAPFKTEEALDLVKVEFQKEVKFFQHVSENNIIMLNKLTGTQRIMIVSAEDRK